MRKLSVYLCTHCHKPKSLAEMHIVSDGYNLCLDCSGRKKTLEEPYTHRTTRLTEALCN